MHYIKGHDYQVHVKIKEKIICSSKRGNLIKSTVIQLDENWILKYRIHSAVWIACEVIYYFLVGKRPAVCTHILSRIILLHLVTQ